jgi:hypothetical protein
VFGDSPKGVWQVAREFPQPDESLCIDLFDQAMRIILKYFKIAIIAVRYL